MNDPLVSKKRNMSSATRHPIIKKRKNGDNTSFVSIPPEMLVMIAQKVDRGTSVNLRTVNRLFKSVTTFVHGSQRLTDIWKLISQMALTSQNQNYDRIWIHNRSARDQIFNLDCAYIAVLSASIVGNIRFAKWALDRLVFPGAVAVGFRLIPISKHAN